ncbi:MAG: KH domain-containing protein [Candidatus Dormibacteria bacterium]
MTDYADLTRFVIERMVGTPEAVTVRSVVKGRTTIIEVGVAEADMGKLIGKGGRNIDAVRAVVRAAGLRGHERVQVELADQR